MRVSDLQLAQWTDLLAGQGACLRMGPFVYRMRTTLPELARSLKTLYHWYHLLPDEGFIDFEVAVVPRHRWERWRGRHVSFIIDGSPVFTPFARELALPMFEWAVNWCVFTRPHQYLVLHSAVLEHQGLAIILPGRPGAGKSTLCAGLSLRHWRLLSDEVCVIRPGDPTLIPVPRPVGLKEQSIAVIKAFEPSACLGPATPGTRKGTVAHLQVDQQAIDRAADRPAPAMIVFPTYQAGAPLTLTPFSKARTFLRIAEDAFNFSVLGRAGFETLSQLVETCDCYTLAYSDMQGAIDHLTGLVTEKRS